VIKLASVLGISIDDLVPIHKFNAEPSLANLIAEIDRLKSDLRESEDLVEHLQDKRTELQREVEMLRKAAGDASAELYKAVGWICREVEAGTKSATHWAIRLGSSAKVLEAAIAKGGSNG
jgi:predicted  nucleic acid-binding Zn-ribbon protein